MTEDGDRIVAIKDLFATLFLEAFIVLRNEGLLSPDSPIKDIGLIAALIVKWGDCKRKSAIRRIVRMCQNAGIEISRGPEGLEENVDVKGFVAGNSNYHSDGSEEDEEDEEDEDEEWVDESRWKKEGEEEADGQPSGFQKQLRLYRSTIPVSRIGGQEFNPSKWAEKELKWYSYEKEDGSVNTTKPISVFDPRGPYIHL